jgi:chloramphenicol O-acetyltransferase
MISAADTYPGDAELPSTPAQMADEFRLDMFALRKQLENLIAPVQSVGGFSVEGFVEGYGDDPSAVGLAAARISIASNITRAIEELADWAYNGWAARFIKGSSGPQYRYSDNHDGAHYWVARDSSLGTHSRDLNSQFWNDDGRVSRTRLDSSRQLWSGTGTGNDGYKGYAPQRFWYMVGSTNPEASRSHLMDGEYEGVYFKGSIKDSEYIDMFSPDSPDKRGRAERYTGGDKALTLDRFGYVRHPGASRPDFTNPDQHPSQMDFHGTFTDGIFAHSDWPKRVYFDTFFWSDCTYKQLWSLYNLAQQEHQIEFFVPRRMAPLTSSPSLLAQGAGADIDPYDYIRPGLGEFNQTPAEPPPGSGGAPAPPAPPVDFTVAGLATTPYSYEQMGQESILAGALQYRNVYFEKIGGVSPLFKNSIGEDDVHHQMDMDSISITSLCNTYGTKSDNIGWWRCARRKYDSIYNTIKRVIYSAYGIDPDTERSAAGGGAVEGGDRGDTNPTTEMDTYIAEGPARITEAALSEVLTQIDNMSSESAADFDLESEREHWAEIFTDKIIQKVRDAAGQYYDTKLCKIYATTCIPDINITRIRNDGDTQQAVAPMFQRLDYATPAGGINRGTDPYPVIPFGYWDFSPTIVRNADAGLGAAAIPEASANFFSNPQGGGHHDFFEFNFGQLFQNAINDNVSLNRDRIYEKIYEYITKRALYAGFRSDTGVHSALAEVDIVLSKYGYFFFDMEKYVRKNSYLSKVLNVDRFLANFPNARQITNSACRLQQVSVGLDNFADNPDGVDRGNYSAVKNLASLQLTTSEESDENKSRPDRFEKLRFLTPLNERTGRPYVYRKINALQGISFSEITDYTVRDGLLTSAATPGALGAGLPTGVTGGGGLTSPVGATPTYTGTTTGGIPSTGTSATLPGAPGGVSLPLVPIEGFEAGLSDELGASRSEQQAEIERQQNNLAIQSVDIDRLIADGRYEPKEVNTHLVLRNYAFPGFSDAALQGGARWRFDYRLMMFKYQFFLDDDSAYSFSNDPEVDDGINSYDKIKFDIKLKDESKEVFYEMAQTFFDTYQSFVTNYFEFAEEACAFNAFDQGFNEFFVTQMTNKYPDPPSTPWHTMVAVYTTYVNIMTDQYGGDSLLMFETANNLLELIRPATGNLTSLKKFNDACLTMATAIRSARLFLMNDVDEVGETKTVFSFSYDTVLGAPVIDHIGDYAEDLLDPSMAEIGGDNTLYDMDDF